MGLDDVGDVIRQLCADLQWHEGYPPAPGESIYHILPGEFLAIESELVTRVNWPAATDLRFESVTCPDGRELQVPYAARVGGAYVPGVLDGEWGGTGRKMIVRARINPRFKGASDAFTLEEAALPLVYIDGELRTLFRSIRDSAGRRCVAVLDALMAT